MSKATSLKLHLADVTLEHAQQQSISVDLSTRERFEAAVRPLWPRLYRACLARTAHPSTAEDLLQASLIKAYTHRHSYEGRGSLLGWLLHIVQNEHIEHCRKEARRRTIFQTVSAWLEPLLEPAPSPDPEQIAQLHIEYEHLLEALQSLPEQFRTIVTLCDIEEMPQDEVASLLDIPIGTVKSRHARGRARLLLALQQRQGNTI